MTTVTEIVANPADMLGPTVTAMPFPNTVNVEPVTAELHDWLAARGIDDAFDTTHRIVVRRQSHIHAVLPPYAPVEALEHIAARVAGTWDARVAEVG
jgi:hypothetical protein